MGVVVYLQVDSGVIKSMFRYKNDDAIYRVHVKKSLIISLVCVILLFLFSKKIPIKKREITIRLSSITNVDIIPMTTQGSINRQPDLPEIPIPVEDEYIPDNVTIRMTELDLSEDFDFPGFGFSSLPPRLARPILDVFPEYPEEERKKGIEGLVEVEILVNMNGTVDRVRVINNTTGSRRLQRSAVDAAKRTKYAPAKSDKEDISVWIRRSYRFKN